MAKEQRIYKAYLKLANKLFDAYQDKKCKRVINEIKDDMDKVVTQEKVTVKTLTDKMTDYDKNKINCAMHKMFALCDIMEGAIIDFEQGLKTASGEPHLTIEVCSQARVMKHIAHGLITTVMAAGDEQTNIHFADMAEEIEGIVEKYTLDNGANKNV